MKLRTTRPCSGWRVLRPIARNRSSCRYDSQTGETRESFGLLSMLEAGLQTRQMNQGWKKMNFKAIVVQNLHSITSNHLDVAACPRTLTGQALRNLALKGFAKHKQSTVRGTETNVLSIDAQTPPMELEGATRSETQSSRSWPQSSHTLGTNPPYFPTMWPNLWVLPTAVARQKLKPVEVQHQVPLTLQAKKLTLKSHLMRKMPRLPKGRTTTPEQQVWSTWPELRRYCSY